VTISPCKILQADKDNLYIRIILNNLVLNFKYYQIILIAFIEWPPNTSQSPIPRRRHAITDLERRIIRASSLSTKTRDFFL
jgi:hypothetical protein